MEATLQDAEQFMARCQAIVDAYMNEQFPTLDRKVLTLEPGRRYYKIVATQGSSVSVWAFVDKTNGDVLKPASWKKPAKHARGNVHDDQQGMGWIGPYGPAYLR